MDLAFVLENWMSDRYDVQVSHHALGDICVYARYKDWLCSKDERLKEVWDSVKNMKHESNNWNFNGLQ